MALAGCCLIPPSPAAADPNCPGQPVQAQPGPPGVPWAQQRFDLDRLADLGVDGSGVTVAVVDSGVAANQPQLKGHVEPGWDAFGATNGQEDCIGHGTAVASLIAAQATARSPFRGLAPGATILPLRATERTEDNPTARGNAASVADAINQAVRHNPQPRVINLSLALTDDQTEVRAAVANAVAHNIVVVAAVGNGHDDAGDTAPDGSRALRADPPSYPAAYPDVIGVGAIDQNGARYPKSLVNSYVNLVAPGARVQAAVPGGGYALFDGTSLAAPLVAATAALIIQHEGPNITAAEVARRLIATADPAPGSRLAYGSGIVNPYRAVTEVVSDESPHPLGAALPPPAGAGAAAATRAQTRRIAVPVAAGLALCLLVLVLTITVATHGRERGWRPGSTPPGT